ncbi:MAG: hypothetical protein Ct9H300mP15_13020 [Gemmatimonadota bacterium]|nr:MAG: hypothetical protein Ct9H300mP15_13020 [Gemmatimonadota bacterium]
MPARWISVPRSSVLTALCLSRAGAVIPLHRSIASMYTRPVSTDQNTNSDMTPDAAELRVIEQQFARFASVCRPYAPSYRQITLAGLMARFSGGDARDLAQGLAYNDVKDAFEHYLEYDNDGRGFVLIGHSQGSYILTRLIHDEIEGHPGPGPDDFSISPGLYCDCRSRARYRWIV